MHRGWQQITPKGGREDAGRYLDSGLATFRPIHIPVVVCQSDSLDPASFWDLPFAIGKLFKTSLALARLLKNES